MMLPPQLLSDLRTVPGFDEAAFLQAHTQPAVTSIRKHPLKQSGLVPSGAAIPWCEDGTYLSERPVFTLDPLFHAGAYYVQEASSMFLQHLFRSLVPDTRDLRVLDLCAAPGGKSTLLASLLDESALLVSNEVIRSRASVLEENVVRWGYANNWVTCNDPRDFSRLGGFFDVIVVDAPCSGSGLFRKDPHALEEWSEANVHLCSQRQQRIIDDVWPALKENGIFIYATCSYAPAEDEQMLDRMAEAYPVTSLAAHPDPAWGIVTVTSDKGLQGYRFFPDKLAGEGFFIGAVRKLDQEQAERLPAGRTKHDAAVAARCADLVKDIDRFAVLPGRDAYYAIRREHGACHELLARHLYLRRPGLRLGSLAGKDLLPDHELALSTDRMEGVPAVSVNKEQALRFLKKEDMSLTLSGKGWLLVTFEGLGLGWIKSLGNRYNNYLPKHWRIRMELPSNRDRDSD